MAANRTSFKKNHPGGPGRTRGSGRDQLLEDWVTKKGLPFLKRVAEGKEPDADLRSRVDAAKYLIDRARGKAPQAVEHSGTDGEPLEIKVIHVNANPAP